MGTEQAHRYCKQRLTHGAQHPHRRQLPSRFESRHGIQEEQGESAVITETYAGTIPPWPARRFLFNEMDTESMVRGRVQDRSRETISRC